MKKDLGLFIPAPSANTFIPVIEPKKFLISVDDYFTDFRIVERDNPEKVVVDLKEFLPDFFKSPREVGEHRTEVYEVELPIEEGDYTILMSGRNIDWASGFMFVQDGFYDNTKAISKQRYIEIINDGSSSCHYARDSSWSMIGKHETYSETFWISFYGSSRFNFKGNITVS